MRHLIETPASRCFRSLEWNSGTDTFTVTFRDGTIRSYKDGKRLFAEARTIQHNGGSLGRWYNRYLRGA